LLDRPRTLGWTQPMAARPASAPETIRGLTVELYRRIAEREINGVEMMYVRYRQGGASTIERRHLLPLDLTALKAEPGQPPLHNLAAAALLEKLMAEYVFALLMEAAVESIASENAARFAAMDSTRDNVSKKLKQLRRESRQARQSEITTELVDLVIGAEALASNRA
jgi:F-type H+-transporting ATPase subunit gamma